MTNQNLKSVFDALVNALQSDAALIAWCQDEFEEQPVIEYGVDPDDMPEGPSSALIRINPGSRSRTRGDNYRSHTLTVNTYVKESKKRIGSGWASLEAYEKLDEFTNLVEEVVYPTLQSLELAVSPFDGEPDHIIHPYAKAQLAYQIEIPARMPA